MAGQIVISAVANPIADKPIGGALSAISDYYGEMRSQTHNIRMLDMNLCRLGSVLDKTRDLPTTCRKKRHDLKLLKDAYKEGRDLLERFQPQQADTGEAVTTLSQRFWSTVSSRLKCLTSKDVQRYQWYADEAEKWFEKFTTCACHECKPRKNPNPNTLVRYLLQGKTIRYASQEGSHCRISPVRLQERGVEAALGYHFQDLRRPGKCYAITLLLRVRESTDIVGMALECLKSLPSQLEHVRKFAMTQLKLLADTKGTINISHAPPCDGFEARCEEITLKFRPDSFCCKNREKNTNSTTSSESLSGMFPEEIIVFRFNCNAGGAVNYNFGTSPEDVIASRDISEDSMPPLKVELFFIPHLFTGSTGGLVELEETGEKKKRVYVGRQQEYPDIEECFFRQPQLTKYRESWLSNHGMTSIAVEKSTFLEAMHSFEKVKPEWALDQKKSIQVLSQMTRLILEEWPEVDPEVLVRLLEMFPELAQQEPQTSAEDQQLVRRLEMLAELLAQQEPQRSAEIQPRRGTSNLLLIFCTSSFLLVALSLFFFRFFFSEA